MALKRVNTHSTEYSGTTVLPKDSSRSYFFIVFKSGEGTISFGDGGGEIPMQEGFHYSPFVAPTSKITITSTDAVYVIHEG